MLFDLVGWQRAAVQVIKTECTRLGWFIDEVYKASTGTWYVRLASSSGADKVCVRLGDHHGRRHGPNRRLLSVKWTSGLRLQQLESFLKANQRRIP